MSRPPRMLLLVIALLVLLALGGAHWVVANMARPTFHTCRGSGANMIMTGMGSEAPDVRRLCLNGVRVAARATLNVDTGTLRVTADVPNLGLLDGVRSTDVKVTAHGVDHSDDALRFRLLELATPFAQLDPTQSYAPDDTAPVTYEVGRPRVQPGNGGAALTMELGDAAKDDTVLLSVTRVRSQR